MPVPSHVALAPHSPLFFGSVTHIRAPFTHCQVPGLQTSLLQLPPGVQVVMQAPFWQPMLVPQSLSRQHLLFSMQAPLQAL
jgi:hypothetical protein